MTRLVLVGAGHTHLHLIARAEDLARAGITTTVIADRWFHYSGMGSAVAGGAVPPAANRIDVVALCRRHRVPLIEGRATGLDLDRRIVQIEGDRRATTDRLSLNVGSDAATGDINVGEDVVRVKPLAGLEALPARVDGLPRNGRIVVIGGGASAIEIATNLAARGRGTVTVIGRPTMPVPVAATAVSSRIREILSEAGVDWRGGSTVTSVTGGTATLEDGTRFAYDLAVLAVGLRPSATIADLGLADDTGHMPTDETLTHPDHRWITGAGDAARFLPRPLPKIGVFGVRAGPVLADILVARARGVEPPVYRPQQNFLAILDLATTGLAMHGDHWHEGRLSLWLKRLIDKRWLNRYR